MTERLLQYIWQFQYFNNSLLHTTNEQALQVINPGKYNTNQGPDFLNAKIWIDNTIWAGSIELHINTSDWKQHNHSNDKNYNNVILHVVWYHDQDLQLPFPTLELQSRVSKLLLNKYDELLRGTQFIPCEKQIQQVIEPLTIISWKERLLIERLQQKAAYIEKFLQRNNQHWEETFWWMLARNFGAKINSDSFEKLGQSIPINLFAKHKQQIHQLEALLMGQSGLLDKNFTDDYPLMLQKEYHFLQKKYRLNKIHEPVYFLRMRPANFPTIRLAQLAVLIQQSQHLFSSSREMSDYNDAAHLFSDLISFALSLLAINLAKKKSSDKYSYGYIRAESLGALFSIIIIWVLTFWILLEASEKIKSGNYVTIKPLEMLLTAIFGFIVNIIMGFTLHSTNLGHGFFGHSHQGCDHNHESHCDHEDVKDDITIENHNHDFKKNKNIPNNWSSVILIILSENGNFHTI